MNNVFRRIALAVAVTFSSLVFAAPAGLYNLGDSAITTAVTNSVITSGVSQQGVAQAFISRLEGATAATFQVNFNYGAGGTTVKLDIFTTLDQGTTWIILCRFAFATASAEKIMNVSGLTPRLAAYTPTTPSDDTCVDGIIGDRIRAATTVVGTYTGNSSLSVRASIR